MDTVGGLFGTSRSPTQATTSSAITSWAGTVGWASHGVCTTCPYNTYAWGHLYYSYYYSCCSTGFTFYIWGLHHHFCRRVFCHATYILDTDHYTHYFILADGWHTCSAWRAYYYPSSDSTAFGTSTTPQPDIPGPSEPIALAKETTRADVSI